MWYNIEDSRRILTYEKYERFYNNQYTSAEKNKLPVDSIYYVAANLAKSIIEITPDFLFGEAPRVTSKNQDLIDYIAETTKFNTLMYRTALTATIKGDAVIKLYLHNNQVKAQLIQPENFFPTYNLFGDLEEVTIATIIETEEKFSYLLKEIITKEKIIRSLHKIDENKNIKEDLSITSHPLTKGLAASEINVLGIVPIIHIPNILSPKSDTFGVADLAGCDELILAINKRLTEIDYIITKHADPKLQVPMGILDSVRNLDIIEQGDAKFVHITGLDNQDFKVIEKSPQDAEMKYVQPDLNLASAFEELDRLVNLLLLQTKTSPSLVNNNKDGGQAESGKALRLRLMDTERKLRQKKVFYEKAIKEFYTIAQMLLNKQPEIVDVEFINMLNDTTENIDNALKLYNNNLISHKEALKIAYPNTAEEEIDRMILEKIEETLFNNKSPEQP